MPAALPSTSMAWISDLLQRAPGAAAAACPLASRLAVVAACAVAAGAACAGPVDASVADTPPPDPTEVALRWTLSGLSGLGGLSPALPALAAPLPQAPAPTSRPGVPAAGTEGGVPDPAAYALMGLLLVGAGLAARRWRRGGPGRSGAGSRSGGSRPVGPPRSA
jgi:hypothetical protein